VSDEKLEARIRSELGHLVDRPGDISVEVNDGHVVLSGSASPDEVASVTRELAGMNGVADVENRMQ
ncbi:MAG TPA: BON domain-containing protein, partial [Luteimonas sp.]|nr:BON domain-containing protein [Luteimonas sp.]